MHAVALTRTGYRKSVTWPSYSASQTHETTCASNRGYVVSLSACFCIGTSFAPTKIEWQGVTLLVPLSCLLTLLIWILLQFSKSLFQPLMFKLPSSHLLMSNVCSLINLITYILIVFDRWKVILLKILRK